MKTEVRIKLDKFAPRPYQLDVCQAFESGKYKKFLIVNPRRSGKDYYWFALMIREAIRVPGLYLYCLPTFAQGRSVIFEGKDNQGAAIIDQLPKELIKRMRQDSMTIDLVNGSTIRIVGSDNYDRSIVGSNPRMIVFSEYAQCDPNAYKLAALPIIKANNGIVVMNSTPRGNNHMYELYEIAKNSTEWYTQFLTIEDTKHISEEEVRKLIDSGEISEDLALQEFYCSFQYGQEGSYYNKYIDKMKFNGQIGIVPHEPNHKVHTAWDLGVSDSCVILFFQVIGQTVKVIDCYDKTKEGLEHYVNVLESKPYSYGKHFAPHDIAVQEFGSGLTRLEKAMNLGIKFEYTTDKYNQKHSAIPNVSIMDGIESVRSAFSKIWIDEIKCKKLIKSLENYRQEFDNKRMVYKSQPFHDNNSDFADAFRYMVLSLNKMKIGTSSQELNDRYRRVITGQPDLPEFFR